MHTETLKRKKAPRVTEAYSQGEGERSPMVSITVCVCVSCYSKNRFQLGKLLKTFVRRQEIALFSSRNQNFSRGKIFS